MDKAIELEPNFAGAYMNLGTAKAHLKEYDVAIKDYDKAIELNPNYALAYYNRGLACRELGKEKEAIEDFKKAQELDPTLIRRNQKRSPKTRQI